MSTMLSTSPFRSLLVRSGDGKLPDVGISSADLLTRELGRSGVEPDTIRTIFSTDSDSSYGRFRVSSS